MRLRLFALSALLLSVALPAMADSRLALVIGNGATASPGVPALRNPVADSALIADRLRRSDFTVTHVTDADLPTMREAFAGFGRTLRAAGRDATGLFFYAGHAVQSFGTNVLLPVDTHVADPADLSLLALEAEAVLRPMSSAQNRTNIVILDACRNNPVDTMAAFGTNGLAEMRAPTGTFLAYATAPGDVAVDGTGGNSPFTAALAEKMTEPGRAIEEVLRRVRVSVIEATLGRQTPWDTSSLTPAFTFVEVADPLRSEADAFAAAQREGLAAAWQAFLDAFPTSIFAQAALIQHNMAAESKAPAPTPAATALGTGAAAAWDRSRRSRDLVIARFLSNYPGSAFMAEAESLLDDILALMEEVELAAAAGPKRAVTVEDPSRSEADPRRTAGGVVVGRLAVARRPGGKPANGGTRQDVPGPIAMTAPLVDVDPSIRGKTIAEVMISGSPLFLPVDGLPSAYWSGQTWKPLPSVGRRVPMLASQNLHRTGCQRGRSEKASFRWHIQAGPSSMGRGGLPLMAGAVAQGRMAALAGASVCARSKPTAQNKSRAQCPAFRNVRYDADLKLARLTKFVKKEQLGAWAIVVECGPQLYRRLHRRCRGDHAKLCNGIRGIADGDRRNDGVLGDDGRVIHRVMSVDFATFRIEQNDALCTAPTDNLHVRHHRSRLDTIELGLVERILLARAHHGAGQRQRVCRFRHSPRHAVIEAGVVGRIGCNCYGADKHQASPLVRTNH